MKNPPRPEQSEENSPDPESRRVCRGQPSKTAVLMVRPGQPYYLVAGIVCFCPKQAAAIDLK